MHAYTHAGTPRPQSHPASRAVQRSDATGAMVRCWATLGVLVLLVLLVGCNAAAPAPSAPPQLCSLTTAPTIAESPGDVTVFDGQTAEFRAKASNAATFQWLEGDNPAPGATGTSGVDVTTLTLFNVTMADDGKQFRVRASNCFGSVVSSAGGRLTVNPLAPFVTQAPRSTTVPEGQSATFGVEATGTAPLSYQWRRDGAEIAGATSESYTLSNVTLGDHGARFDVIVANAAGTTQSGVATLTVEERTSPASLDRSFAGTGVVVTTLAGHDLFPHTLVNLPDGRHALVGRARAFDRIEATKLAIAVYRPDGTPDTSVGTDGLIVRDVAAWFADRAPAEAFKRVVLAEAPARIAAYHERNGVAGVVVGMSAVTQELGLERYYAVLVRLQLAGAATGSLDPGFGVAGVVRRTSPTDPSWRMTRGVAVDGSQRIYELWTTGFTTASLQGSGSSLLRWRADGSADPSWGGGGEVVLNDPINAPGQRVAVQPDGKVLLVGIERDNALRYPIVARFDASGGADTGYGTDGRTRVANAVSFAFLSGGAAVWDQERDASGRTLLAVSGAGYFYVARLSSNGEFDTSFTDLAAIPGDAGYWRQQAECGLRALQDGRLLAVSYFQSGFSIRRWQADLSALDGSFNRDADGLAQIAIVYPFENLSFAGFFCFATHLQDDGRILIAGRAYGTVAGLPNGFGLVRLRGGEY
jgi:uncharacterized delta-60 repeat protein